jgi:hypothetical protein
MSLPVTSGLVGWYKGESWNGTSWPDLSGNGNNCTEIKGTINSSGRFMYGTKSDGVRFPTAILPSTYTLFHVAMYNGANRGRIFDGVGNVNWLSGFHGGKTGVAHHGAWLTQQATTAFPVSNVLVSTDQKALYRGNGTNLTINSVTGSSDRLSINYGYHTSPSITENSDWAVFEVVVYNRELSLSEIESVESYLNARLDEIDLNMIRDNLGGTNPISFGDYYDNSGYLPSSGQIGYNNFKNLFKVISYPVIPVENLQVMLDATNSGSYPGSGTAWYDISGNGRHGTWTAAPNYDSGGWFNTNGLECTGPASNSFEITNTSGYTIFITWYQYSLTSPITFQFYRTGTGNANRGIYSHCTWIDTNIYFDQGWTGSIYPRIYGACPDPTGHWHTTAFVRDANSTMMRIYLDGSLFVYNTQPSTTLSLSSTAVNYVGPGGAWNAALRCFIAYNRNLSASEISALHTKYIP